MGEKASTLRKYLPTVLWIVGLIALYLILRAVFAPYTSGINLNSRMVLGRIREVSLFLGAIAAVMVLIEVYFYQIFFRRPTGILSAVIVRTIQGVLGLAMLLLIIAFFDLTDLIRLPEGPFRNFVLLPTSGFAAFQKFLAATKMVSAGQAPLVAAVLLLVVLGLLFYLIQRITEPRVSQVGLAYLLTIPALIGVLFLIIYPFLFEIKLAFSNASLGTQATKNASYGLQYGWQNLVTLFTGNVAKDAKFFEVLGRTVLWTIINVTFHVTIGMVLALLLHRPMKLQGFYRTLLVFPWAVPTTIAAMALRNEFDLRYGFFNIMLNNIHNFFADLSTKVALLSSGLLLAGREYRPGLLETGPLLGLRLHPDLQHLAGHPLHGSHHPGRPAEHLPRVLRGGGDGRRQQMADVPQHHPAAPAPGPHPRHHPGRHLDLQQI